MPHNIVLPITLDSFVVFTLFLSMVMFCLGFIFGQNRLMKESRSHVHSPEPLQPVRE